MIRIKKFKASTKESKITMEYQAENKSGGWDDFSFTSAEPALPSLFEALQALGNHVIDMCELPADYRQKILVKGVTAAYAGDEDVMGATITAQLVLERSNANLNLNTPYKIERPYAGDGDPKQLMSGDCKRDIYALFNECQKYIEGIRAQGDLFAEEQKAAA